MVVEKKSPLIFLYLKQNVKPLMLLCPIRSLDPSPMSWVEVNEYLNKISLWCYVKSVLRGDSNEGRVLTAPNAGEWSKRWCCYCCFPDEKGVPLKMVVGNSGEGSNIRSACASTWQKKNSRLSLWACVHIWKRRSLMTFLRWIPWMLFKQTETLS